MTMRLSQRFCALFALLVLAAPAPPAGGHDGHQHAPAPGEQAAGADGPLQVSEAAQRNLGLLVEEVELRSVESTLRVIGELTAAPERSATVASRIAGRVTEVYANEGDRVRKGQPLAEVESLQVGDPPPRARYAAPVTGVVIDRHVVRGDQVEPSAHLLELTDLRELIAVGRVFEGQIGSVSVGQKVRVRAPAMPEAIFEGQIERIAGGLDARSRSLPIYVRVANPDERLRPSMRATLDLVTGGAELAIAVPRRAVLGEAGALFAFVQSESDPTRFERRALVLGVTNDSYAEVVEGLLPGERVVTQGNYSLQYLAPVPEAAAEGAAPASARPSDAAAAEPQRLLERAPPASEGFSATARPRVFPALRRLATPPWSWAAALGGAFAAAAWLGWARARLRARASGEAP
jgi:cobalt-zinc-cadmium efflux system membrane fusion protein